MKLPWRKRKKEGGKKFEMKKPHKQGILKLFVVSLEGVSLMITGGSYLAIYFAQKSS